MKKLFHNLVIVLPQEMEDLEVGGLTIPSTAKDTCHYGIIAKVGDECTRVNEGDKILYKNQAGEDVFINGVPHLLMTERDLIGVV